MLAVAMPPGVLRQAACMGVGSALIKLSRTLQVLQKTRSAFLEGRYLSLKAGRRIANFCVPSGREAGGVPESPTYWTSILNEAVKNPVKILNETVKNRVKNRCMAFGVCLRCQPQHQAQGRVLAEVGSLVSKAVVAGYKNSHQASGVG